MDRIVIVIGAGGHGKVVADLVMANNDIVFGFLDDNAKGVLGKVCDYVRFPEAEFIVAIGNTAVRERIAGSMSVKWYTAIHPSAVVSPSASIGEGTVIMPNAVVNAGAEVGRHCIINTSAVVEHDNKIGDFAHISVGSKLAGTVSVGARSWIGIGAAVTNGVNIGEGVMIGAGAVVVKDIKEPGTYIGIPAQKVQDSEKF